MPTGFDREAMRARAAAVARTELVTVPTARLPFVDAANDTSEEARRRQRDVLRAAGGASRLRTALEMSQLTRDLAMRRLRDRRPEATPAELATALLRRLYPDVLRRDRVA